MNFETIMRTNNEILVRPNGDFFNDIVNYLLNRVVSRTCRIFCLHGENEDIVELQHNGYQYLELI